MTGRVRDLATSPERALLSAIAQGTVRMGHWVDPRTMQYTKCAGKVQRLVDKGWVAFDLRLPDGSRRPYPYVVTDVGRYALRPVSEWPHRVGSDNKPCPWCGSEECGPIHDGSRFCPTCLWTRTLDQEDAYPPQHGTFWTTNSRKETP